MGVWGEGSCLSLLMTSVFILLSLVLAQQAQYTLSLVNRAALHEPVRMKLGGSPTVCSSRSDRQDHEGLASAKEETPPRDGRAGTRLRQGAVPGSPALLTPHRPRSPQQRVVQSQSASPLPLPATTPVPRSLRQPLRCPLSAPCSSGTGSSWLAAPGA